MNNEKINKYSYWKANLKIVSIEDLIAYRMKNDSLIDKIFDENIKRSL